MSNLIFITVFIVCTVTKDVILVNRIKYKMYEAGAVRGVSAVLTIIIKRNISLLLLEPFQSVTITPS